MTVIATIRQDRITNLLVTPTPASYLVLPSWAAKQETIELPSNAEEVLDDLSAQYSIEYLGTYETPAGDNYNWYRLEAYQIGPDGQPVCPETPSNY